MFASNCTIFLWFPLTFLQTSISWYVYAISQLNKFWIWTVRRYSSFLFFIFLDRCGWIGKKVPCWDFNSEFREIYWVLCKPKIRMIRMIKNPVSYLGLISLFWIVHVQINNLGIIAKRQIWYCTSPWNKIYSDSF